MADDVETTANTTTNGTYDRQKSVTGLFLTSLSQEFTSLSNYSFFHFLCRIVVFGKKKNCWLVPNTAKMFNFQKEFSMTEQNVEPQIFL